jgi:uncharacterized protein
MTRAIAAFALLFILIAQFGHADEAQRRALVEEFFELTQVPQNVGKVNESVFQLMVPATIQMIEAELKKRKPLGEKLPEKVNLMREKIMGMFRQQFAWDNLKEDYIKIYTEMFTEQELKDLVTFYKSPAGRKFAEKQPELINKSLELGREKGLALVPQIEQTIREVLDNDKSESQSQPQPDAPAAK